MAGAFISFGAVFATTVSAGHIVISPADGATFSAALPYGAVRLLTGLAFTLGLILVVIAGAELFTGNNLIVMAWASGKVTTRALLRNWAIVFAGNSVGALLTAALMFVSTQYTFGDGAVGLAALKTANAKASLAFVPALTLGIMCNALVCLGVWMCYSARTTVGKIFAIVPPVAAFVAAGFEHSIANIYFIPLASVHKGGRGGVILDFNRHDGSRFSRSDVEQFFGWQPSSSHHWQYHRWLGNGRRDLLVCLLAKEQAHRRQLSLNRRVESTWRLNLWIGLVALSDRRSSYTRTIEERPAAPYVYCQYRYGRRKCTRSSWPAHWQA